ncbi:MAG: sigma-70 family RNA polymerase sigma factor [Sedimentisphaerales bacterium]|nr:sigma-70 family RNA polymerase sigma factor [Sedimentisphaerales bacterium]
MNQITDEQLMELSLTGDKKAFNRLVRRYESELYNFLYKFLGQKSLAEDVFQETFLQVYLSAHTFNTGRRFRPWVYTIAANKARDLLRSRSRRPTIQITSSDEDTSDTDIWHNLLKDEITPDQILEKEQQKQLVQKIVAEMPDNLREILILAYFKQLSYKEMAEILDIPLGTVKSRLHSAVANFAKKYKEANK